MEAPSGGPDARVLTLIALGIEASLGLALWGLFDRSVDGWQARLYEEFRGKYPEALVLLYVNHLDWEMGEPTAAFTG